MNNFLLVVICGLLFVGTTSLPLTIEKSVKNGASCRMSNILFFSDTIENTQVWLYVDFYKAKELSEVDQLSYMNQNEIVLPFSNYDYELKYSGTRVTLETAYDYFNRYLLNEENNQQCNKLFYFSNENGFSNSCDLISKFENISIYFIDIDNNNTNKYQIYCDHKIYNIQEIFSTKILDVVNGFSTSNTNRKLLQLPTSNTPNSPIEVNSRCKYGCGSIDELEFLNYDNVQRHISVIDSFNNILFSNYVNSQETFIVKSSNNSASIGPYLILNNSINSVIIDLTCNPPYNFPNGIPELLNPPQINSDECKGGLTFLTIKNIQSIENSVICSIEGNWQSFTCNFNENNNECNLYPPHYWNKLENNLYISCNDGRNGYLDTSCKTKMCAGLNIDNLNLIVEYGISRRGNTLPYCDKLCTLTQEWFSYDTNYHESSSLSNSENSNNNNNDISKIGYNNHYLDCGSYNIYINAQTRLYFGQKFSKVRVSLIDGLYNDGTELCAKSTNTSCICQDNLSELTLRYYANDYQGNERILAYDYSNNSLIYNSTIYNRTFTILGENYLLPSKIRLVLNNKQSILIDTNCKNTNNYYFEADNDLYNSDNSFSDSDSRRRRILTYDDYNSGSSSNSRSSSDESRDDSSYDDNEYLPGLYDNQYLATLNFRIIDGYYSNSGYQICNSNLFGNVDCNCIDFIWRYQFINYGLNDTFVIFDDNDNILYEFDWISGQIFDINLADFYCDKNITQYIKINTISTNTSVKLYTTCNFTDPSIYNPNQISDSTSDYSYENELKYLNPTYINQHFDDLQIKLINAYSSQGIRLCETQCFFTCSGAIIEIIIENSGVNTNYYTISDSTNALIFEGSLHPAQSLALLNLDNSDWLEITKNNQTTQVLSLNCNEYVDSDSDSDSSVGSNSMEPTDFDISKRLEILDLRIIDGKSNGGYICANNPYTQSPTMNTLSPTLLPTSYPTPHYCANEKQSCIDECDEDWGFTSRRLLNRRKRRWKKCKRNCRRNYYTCLIDNGRSAGSHSHDTNSKKVTIISLSIIGSAIILFVILFYLGKKYFVSKALNNIQNEIDTNKMRKVRSDSIASKGLDNQIEMDNFQNKL